jgi:hypothetical protein
VRITPNPPNLLFLPFITGLLNELPINLLRGDRQIPVSSAHFAVHGRLLPHKAGIWRSLASKTPEST